MSTVAEIIAAVENLPEPEMAELLGKLVRMGTKSTPYFSAPYVVQPLPLGTRTADLKDIYTPERDAEEIIIQRGCTCEVPEDFPL